jgi:uncharacterized protein YcfJ
VLGGVKCAALHVVCGELRGIMRICFGQQHRCRSVLVRELREPCREGRVGHTTFAPVQAGVVGAHCAVLGGQRLSWAADARAAGGTWGITAH